MDASLMRMLTTLGYALPELLACGVALALLWSSAQRGRARDHGLWGAGLMLVCAVLQLGIGFYQTWMIDGMQGDSAVGMSRLFALLGAVRLLVNCVSLGGFLLVVWALCQATRTSHAAPPPA
ncbi:hypothetical protein DT603_11015 [Pseudoxanthomonas gei]|uniref:Uncharacterized protein n=1 Tax=Pseudoxanthomonas gei TaxID=1383030 RepID=A0ABX0ACS3_9GAMM|nr:hypothetical protein [Pseudoxanthomonas gei]NDK39372.1 hypothetical protein [Pseudoxanthomonas gei]